MQDRAGTLRRQRLLPRRLEYYRKDDKFRLYSAGCRSGRTINVARIRFCRRLDGIEIKKRRETRQTSPFLTLELTDQRNALERVMLHFSHFEKTAVKLDEEHYRVTLKYRKEDETELVIRVLSFGPLVRVAGPPEFRNLIKDRLIRQKGLGSI